MTYININFNHEESYTLHQEIIYGMRFVWKMKGSFSNVDTATIVFTIEKI